MLARAKLLGDWLALTRMVGRLQYICRLQVRSRLWRLIQVHLPDENYVVLNEHSGAVASFVHIFVKVFKGAHTGAYLDISAFSESEHVLRH
jgi:hypothetical protein